MEKYNSAVKPLKYKVVGFYAGLLVPVSNII